MAGTAPVHTLSLPRLMTLPRGLAAASRTMRPGHRVLQSAKRALFIGLFLTTAGSQSWAQTAWKPERPVEFIIGATPGSALDVIARRLQAIWQEQRIVEAPITAVNKPGGSQSIVTTYLLNQRAGEGHYLEIFASTLLTSHILKNHNVHYADGTPLAYLGEEYYVFVVKPDSPIKSGKDLIDRLRRNSDESLRAQRSIDPPGSAQRPQIFTKRPDHLQSHGQSVFSPEDR